MPDAIQLHPPLHDALVEALQCFQLGEAGEGRIANEARKSADPALDDAAKECIRLYVREEGRHARELAAILRAMDAAPLSRSFAEVLFSKTRRALGLRQKMLTMTVAEVVGIVFYRLIQQNVPNSPIQAVMAAIAQDEVAHLDFQADYFARVIALTPAWRRIATAAGMLTLFMAMLLGGVLTVAIGQRRLLREMGVSPVSLLRACLAELRPRLTRLQSKLRLA